MNGNVIDFENAVEELLKREVREEAGIEICGDLKYVNSVVFVRPDETPVVLLKFAVKYAGGEVKLEKGSFTDYKWINAKEARKLDCVKGIPEEVEKAALFFSSRSKAY